MCHSTVVRASNSNTHVENEDKSNPRGVKHQHKWDTRKHLILDVYVLHRRGLQNPKEKMYFFVRNERCELIL
jgi:hypothetical protein